MTLGRRPITPDFAELAASPLMGPNYFGTLAFSGSICRKAALRMTSSAQLGGIRVPGQHVGSPMQGRPLAAAARAFPARRSICTPLHLFVCVVMPKLSEYIEWSRRKALPNPAVCAGQLSNGHFGRIPVPHAHAHAHAHAHGHARRHGHGCTLEHDVELDAFECTALWSGNAVAQCNRFDSLRR